MHKGKIIELFIEGIVDGGFHCHTTINLYIQLRKFLFQLQKHRQQIKVNALGGDANLEAVIIFLKLPHNFLAVLIIQHNLLGYGHKILACLGQIHIFPITSKKNNAIFLFQGCNVITNCRLGKI